MRTVDNTLATSDAFHTTWILINLYIHPTLARTNATAIAQVWINLIIIEGELVEETIYGAERAEILAKRPVNQD